MTAVNICDECVRANTENNPDLHCHDKRHCFCQCRPGELLNPDMEVRTGERPSQRPTE